MENIKEETWNKYQILLKYPAKIKCSEATLMAKINDDPKTANMMMTMNILDNYMTNHPNLLTLLQILLAVASKRSLEKSYSQLEKLCYKDRN